MHVHVRARGTRTHVSAPCAAMTAHAKQMHTDAVDVLMLIGGRHRSGGGAGELDEVDREGLVTASALRGARRLSRDDVGELDQVDGEMRGEGLVTSTGTQRCT